MMNRIALAAILSGALLAGCSRDPGPPPEPDDAVQTPEETAPPVTAAPPLVAAAAPTPPPAETNFTEPADEPVDPSDQTLEDADATGLTTRATRGQDEQAEPATSEGQAGNND